MLWVRAHSRLLEQVLMSNTNTNSRVPTNSIAHVHQWWQRLRGVRQRGGQNIVNADGSAFRKRVLRLDGMVVVVEVLTYLCWIFYCITGWAGFSVFDKDRNRDPVRTARWVGGLCHRLLLGLPLVLVAVVLKPDFDLKANISFEGLWMSFLYFDESFSVPSRQQNLPTWQWNVCFQESKLTWIQFTTVKYQG